MPQGHRATQRSESSFLQQHSDNSSETDWTDSSDDDYLLPYSPVVHKSTGRQQLHLAKQTSTGRGRSYSPSPSRVQPRKWNTPSPDGQHPTGQPDSAVQSVRKQPVSNRQYVDNDLYILLQNLENFKEQTDRKLRQFSDRLDRICSNSPPLEDKYYANPEVLKVCHRCFLRRSDPEFLGLVSLLTDAAFGWTSYYGENRCWFYKVLDHIENHPLIRKSCFDHSQLQMQYAHQRGFISRSDHELRGLWHLLEEAITVSYAGWKDYSEHLNWVKRVAYHFRQYTPEKEHGNYSSQDWYAQSAVFSVRHALSGSYHTQDRSSLYNQLCVDIPSPTYQPSTSHQIDLNQSYQSNALSKEDSQCSTPSDSLNSSYADEQEDGDNQGHDPLECYHSYNRFQVLGDLSCSSDDEMLTSSGPSRKVLTMEQPSDQHKMLTHTGPSSWNERPVSGPVHQNQMTVYRSPANVAQMLTHRSPSDQSQRLTCVGPPAGRQVKTDHQTHYGVNQPVTCTCSQCLENRHQNWS